MIRMLNLFWQTPPEGSSATAGSWRLASKKEFRRLLACERALADRNRRTVSVIKFRCLDTSPHGQVMQIIANGLDQSNRDIDRAGWIGRNQIAVILPATGCESATSVAQSIQLACNEQARSIEWQVESYPQHQMLPQSAGSANCMTPVGAHSTSLSSLVAGPSQPSIPCASGRRIVPVSPCPRWKRTMDIAGAGLGLIILTPLLLAIALWIKCLSRGPVFFRQQRYGLAGRPFVIWKFRTLETHDAPDRHHSYVSSLMNSNSPLVKRDKELKVIRGGWLLRKLGLDELPQLLNVLNGEMSLVGPRPDIIPLDQYRTWQRRRFDVLPGITGLWQVSGKNGTTFSGMIKLDILYVRRRSVWFDLAILLWTIPAVVRS